MYVDNLGLLSFDDALVRTKLAKTVTDFTQAGLELHETSAGTGEREALGTISDCASFHSRLTILLTSTLTRDRPSPWHEP